LTGESAFLSLLRAGALHPAARGLTDDAAVLEVKGVRLILTSDTLVESVHFLPDDPPESIGWKLAAVNLSDLAAKGARPLACLMNYALSGDEAWDTAFLSGLREALERYGMPLVGGDTVAMPKGALRSYTLTAIGGATSQTVPSRSGAQAGDLLYVTGPVGNAGAGLRLLQAGQTEPEALVEAYRRPLPRIPEGMSLVSIVHAMMDVSDGLLIDVARMAKASGLAVTVDHVPVTADLKALAGTGTEALLAAAIAGDDYELLFALPEGITPPVPAIGVGRFAHGEGLTLVLDGIPVPLPPTLGYEHGT
jgi:thiamine-monophosphate kinase